jgi:hypothetical protein
VIPASMKYRALLVTLGLAVALVPGIAQADQYVVDHCSNWDTLGDPAASPTASTLSRSRVRRWRIPSCQRPCRTMRRAICSC